MFWKFLKVSLICTLFGLFPSLKAESTHDQLNEDEKIVKLLNLIENSGAVFVRNGQSHPAKKARSHLEFKYNKAKNMFWFFGPQKNITAIEFIEQIASKSSTSGEIYKIRLKNSEKAIPTENWLKEKLKEIENFQADSKS
jgi:hypothetical protein